MGKSQKKFDWAANNRKEASLSENTSQILPGLHEIFGLRRVTNFSFFVVCFNLVQMIFF